MAHVCQKNNKEAVAYRGEAVGATRPGRHFERGRHKGKIPKKIVKKF